VKNASSLVGASRGPRLRLWDPVPPGVGIRVSQEVRRPEEDHRDLSPESVLQEKAPLSLSLSLSLFEVEPAHRPARTGLAEPRDAFIYAHRPCSVTHTLSQRGVQGPRVPTSRR